MSRPKLSETKINKSVTLTKDALDSLTKLGKGNLSAGIEMAFQWSRDEIKEELKKPAYVVSAVILDDFIESIKDSGDYREETIDDLLK